MEFVSLEVIESRIQARILGTRKAMEQIRELMEATTYDGLITRYEVQLEVLGLKILGYYDDLEYYREKQITAPAKETVIA